MKIGVFDSGLGGLVITKTFMNELPEYDYLYLGDTAHLPYGEKTSGRILKYTLDSLKYLIAQNCKLIIIACNTATSITLRYIQQKFIPAYAPDVKVLGVVIPTVETAIEENAKSVGIIATSATVASHIYKTELQKLDSSLLVTEVATPQLVPLIEGKCPGRLFGAFSKAGQPYSWLYALSPDKRILPPFVAEECKGNFSG